MLFGKEIGRVNFCIYRNKILIKNLESIKKLAKKEGISLNKLINILKKGE